MNRLRRCRCRYLQIFAEPSAKREVHVMHNVQFLESVSAKKLNGKERNPTGFVTWVPSCRRHLFHTIFFTSRHMTRWLETFPVPEESPAHHVRDLRFSVGGPISVLERFFEHMPWFTNVEGVALSRYNTFKPFWLPSFWRLPQSATSLTTEGI